MAELRGGPADGLVVPDDTPHDEIVTPVKPLHAYWVGDNPSPKDAVFETARYRRRADGNFYY